MVSDYKQPSIQLTDNCYIMKYICSDTAMCWKSQEHKQGDAKKASRKAKPEALPNFLQKYRKNQEEIPQRGYRLSVVNRYDLFVNSKLFLCKYIFTKSLKTFNLKDIAQETPSPKLHLNFNFRVTCHNHNFRVTFFHKNV